MKNILGLIFFVFLIAAILWPVFGWPILPLAIGVVFYGHMTYRVFLAVSEFMSDVYGVLFN